MLRKVVLFYSFLGIVVLEVTVAAVGIVLAMSAWQAIDVAVRKLPSAISPSASIITLWTIFFQIALLVGILALGVIVPIVFWRNVVRRPAAGPPEPQEQSSVQVLHEHGGE